MVESKSQVCTKSSGSQLEILTLGSFSVRNGESDLAEFGSRSRKVWDLFKFFLAHQGQVLLPEVAVEQLWPENDYADPKSTLRTLVYRLRQLLNDDGELIKFYQGGYILKQPKNFWWDVPAFVSNCRLAHQEAAAGNEGGALTSYRLGLSYYQGDFLPECAYNDWVIPSRNYYHQIYLQGVCEMLTILKKQGEYGEIITEAGRALFIDFFQEEIHILYLEALLAEEMIMQARSHYQNVTTVFYREMGLKPSPKMKQLYRQIQSDGESENYSEFSALKETLQNREQIKGAFCCEPDYFRFLCKLESRRLERSGQQAILALLFITTSDDRLQENKLLQEAIFILQQLLQSTLRKGDVFCQLNKLQFMLLLPTSNQEQAQKVLQRIAERFRIAAGEGFSVNFRSQLL
ncbi:MAG: winged helix-turn-helix domain-containing protein [Dethiobacter sp.]|jgi:DNA-binding SARP family transcriptional activator|nr:winged helix-turn-helix domain-containing protein [Dethiobacter sp.]